MRKKCPKKFLIIDTSEIVKDRNLKFDMAVSLETQMLSQKFFNSKVCKNKKHSKIAISVIQLVKNLEICMVIIFKM